MPSATVISDRIDELGSVVEALAAAGWSVARDSSDPVVLAIVDIRDVTHRVAIERVRRTSGIMIGIVVRGAKDEVYDDVMEWPLSRDELDSVIAAWQLPSRAPLDRLAQAFGMGAFRPLVKGLHKELNAALTSPGLPLHAHRLAGLSGTLGFTELSSALEAVSRDGTERLADARRHARTAFVAIEQWLAETIA